MFDLKKLILLLRKDLTFKYQFHKVINSDKYLFWLVTSGLLEYQAVKEDKDFIKFISSRHQYKNIYLTKLQWLIYSGRKDVQRIYPLPKMKNEFLVWFYSHGLEEHRYWNLLLPDEKKIVLLFPELWQTRLQKIKVIDKPTDSTNVPFNRRKFGVNLIGYTFGQLGIGEDVRMAGRSLLSRKVPMTMLNFKPGDDIGQNDLSMISNVSDSGDFAFNVFCLTAEETGRFYAEQGLSQFVDRYNIGYWPWELSAWPKNWLMLLDLVDEVWVSSQHTYNTLALICHKPLKLMPMAVELGHVKSFTSRLKARTYFNLPSKARLFCFAFDLNSSIHRKSPQLCLDAFLSAFPKSDFDADSVGLVIKAHKPTKPNLLWNQLKKLAKRDSRIHIIEQTLSRPELLALYRTCDCFISLHRAEGFGRGIAEAIQLGLHVITTGYSGNVDFCQPPHADLVKYRLIKVGAGQYPHAKGQVWADPDITHAAFLMRQFLASTRKKNNITDFSKFSPDVVGSKYKSRLQQIFAERSSINLVFQSSLNV